MGFFWAGDGVGLFPSAGTQGTHVQGDRYSLRQTGKSKRFQEVCCRSIRRGWSHKELSFLSKFYQCNYILYSKFQVEFPHSNLM